MAWSAPEMHSHLSKWNIFASNMHFVLSEKNDVVPVGTELTFSKKEPSTSCRWPIKFDRLGLIWLGLVWLGLAWLGLAWLGLAWLGLAWLGLVWLGLAWLGLVWRGLVWLGLVWLGLAWFGLVWLGPGLAMAPAWPWSHMAPSGPKCPHGPKLLFSILYLFIFYFGVGAGGGSGAWPGPGAGPVVWARCMDHIWPYSDPYHHQARWKPTRRSWWWRSESILSTDSASPDRLNI